MENKITVNEDGSMQVVFEVSAERIELIRKTVEVYGAREAWGRGLLSFDDYMIYLYAM